MIPQETIERIRSAVDIAEIVREYVPGLKRSGRNFKVCCPFHQERTPSFMVNPEKGIFHCFGCGVGGDVFRFLMKIEGHTFSEAIKKLGDRAGIPVEDEQHDQASPLLRQRQQLHALLDQSNEFYVRCLEKLPEAGRARGYIKKRGISPESARFFALGYAPVSGHALRDAALKKGLQQEMLVQAGLVGYSRQTTELRDHFRNRLVFPIFDTHGHTIAFGGRVLDDGLPKYINSAETPVFTKSRVLYGLYQGARYIRESNRALLLEGYTDVIIAHQFGFRNAVAPLGTALTREHALLLKRYAEEVYLVFDPDAAGQSAAIRAAEILFEAGLFMKIAVLPDKLDPADFILEKGGPAFQNILDHAKNWIEFHIDYLMGAVPHRPLQAEDKARIANSILPLIAKIDNLVYRQDMRRLLSKEIDIPEDALAMESNRQENKYHGKSHKPASLQPPAPVCGRDVRIQEELICLLAHYPDSLQAALVSEHDFSDARCRDIFIALKKEFDQSGNINPSRILSSIDESYTSWLSGIFFDTRVFQKPQRILQELANELKKDMLKVERSRLEGEVLGMLEGRAAIDDEKITAYQRIMRSLKGGERHGQA